MTSIISACFSYGAGRENRTLMVLPPRDFESPWPRLTTLPHRAGKGRGGQIQPLGGDRAGQAAFQFSRTMPG
jgi:hypothetical protein